VKKSFLWLIVITLVVSMTAVFSLAGCKAAEEEKPAEEAPPAAPAEEAPPAEEVGPASFVGEINLMAFNDEFDQMIPMFNEVYPNITVNFEKVPSGEIVAKLESAFSTGAGVPDVFVGEQAWMMRWMAQDVWENLSAEPYNADEAAKDHFDYVKDFARDEDGNLRALTWQSTAGAIFYRRSLAEEAFGVSEPDEVSALMTDMDAFIEMGRTLKENGVPLIPGVNDIQRLYFFNKKQPWVVDGKLVIEDIVLNYMDDAKTIRDEGLDGKIDMWSSEWFAGMNGNIFSYCMPTWGLFFTIEPAITPPEEPEEGVEYAFGDVGLAHGPASYMWGGTWMGISKTSEKKDLAWEFVKYLTTNKEFLKKWALESGDFVSDIAVIEEIKDGYSRESLGGQNHYEYFYEEAKKLSDSGWAQRVTQYDEDIQNAFLTALGEYVNGNMTKDEAIQSFKDNVASLFPEISVE
jgi:ABC-type glycerol-3-phosphate transport system substrate-binding protein